MCESGGLQELGLCAAHGGINPFRSSERRKERRGTIDTHFRGSGWMVGVLLWLLSLQGGARVCAWIFSLSFLVFTPFEHKTKAGYVSQAADTKAPPDFALSSLRFSPTCAARHRRELLGLMGPKTAASVTRPTLPYVH